MLLHVLGITGKVKSVARLKHQERHDRQGKPLPAPNFHSYVIEVEHGEGKVMSLPGKRPKGVAVRMFGGRPREEQLEDILLHERISRTRGVRETNTEARAEETQQGLELGDR